MSLFLHKCQFTVLSAFAFVLSPAPIMVATRSRRRRHGAPSVPQPPCASEQLSAAPILRSFARVELKGHFSTAEASLVEAYAASAPSIAGYVEAVERSVALRGRGFAIDRCLELIFAPDIALRSAMTELGQTEAIHAQRSVIQQSLHAAQSGASAGALRCTKCGSDCVSVQQKQTRSADEGMTIFCSCDGCGVQWRMS